MSRGLKPTTRPVAPHKLSPIIKPPPSRRPDPALVEVLGKGKPDYPPIEPFVRKDLKKPQVVQPIEEEPVKRAGMAKAVEETEESE